MLKRIIQETLRISIETVDIYDNRLDFMADSHRIYLWPKRSKRDDWANGAFRMTVQNEPNHPFHFSWLLILCAFFG